MRKTTILENSVGRSEVQVFAALLLSDKMPASGKQKAVALLRPIVSIVCQRSTLHICSMETPGRILLPHRHRLPGREVGDDCASMRKRERLAKMFNARNGN
jgi:hypothetical protein